MNKHFCDIFFEMAKLHKDNIAVCDSQVKMSYYSLDNWTNYLADIITQSCKEKDNGVVAVALERSVFTVVAIIAILKAGKTYLPINPNYPSERIRTMLDKCDVDLVIGKRDFIEKHEWNSISLEDIRKSYDEMTLYPIFEYYGTNEISYIIFTSGTTGIPKGAVITMSGMMNHLYNKIKLLNMDVNTKIVQTASQCFDISIWQLLAALLVGGQVHILSDEEVRDLHFVLKYLEENEIAIFECVPSYFGKLLREISSLDVMLFELKYILLTGERVPADLCREWYSLNCNAKLINAYGPTECSDDVTHYIVPRNLDEQVVSIPIGYSIDNISLKVAKSIGVNGDIEEANLGEKGELIVEGVCVAEGYVNDLESTQKSFFHNKQGNRCYRTGDIVSKNEQGLFYFWGRMDKQIKINGYRIEPQEIEEIIKKYEGVDDCYVTKKNLVYNQVYLLENKKNIREGIEKEVLIAYIIENKSVIYADLREYLCSKLPSYMIPEQIMGVESFPLTENGKLDEKALPVPKNVVVNRNLDYVAPINQIEKEMATIWEDILGVKPVGRMDNFIDLGGDSLAAIETILSIENKLRKQISYANFVLAKNLEELCEKLIEVDAKKQNMVKIPRKKSYKLSFAEEGQYFLWKLEPTSAYYTFQGMLHIYGDIMYEQINQIINSIVAQNDVLRSNYITSREFSNSLVAKCINEYRFTKYEYRDISDLEESYEIIHKEGKKECSTIFNLENDELFRCKIFKVADKRYVVLMTMHEIIMDAWSIYKFIELFKRMYQRKINENIFDDNCQYQDYAEWEKSVYTKETLYAEKRYWGKLLAGQLPILKMSIAKERPVKLTYKADSVQCIIHKEEYYRIVRYCREKNYTMFTTILSSYFITLYLFSNQNDIIIGCPYANRDTREKENMLGCFLNMLPIRECVYETMTLECFFQHVSETMRDAIENSRYPFMWMVEENKNRRSSNISPIFQVMFDMVNFPHVDFTETDKFSMSFEEIDIGVRKYDLNLYAYEQGEALFLRLSYLTDLYGAEAAVQILDTIKSIIEIVSKNEKVTMFELREMLLFNKSQKADFFDRRSNGIIESESAVKLYELINNNKIDGKKIIYEDQETSITYAELSQEVKNRVKLYKELNLSESSLVVIYADKDVETIINMLALLVLKVTYIPFDIIRDKGSLADLCNDMNVTAVISDVKIDFGNGSKMGNKFFYYLSQKEHDDKKELACIIPTSSSSGKEKYVKITQVGFVNRIYGQDVSLYNLSKVNTMISLRSISLVTHIFELFSNLLYGNRLLLIKRNDVLNIKGVVNIMYSQRVDFIVLSPALLYSIIEEVKRTNKDFDFLNTICSGSAKLNERLVRDCYSVFKNCRLFNTYGTTETSSTVYIQEIASDSKIIAGTVIDGMSVCIENENRIAVGPGIIGNIVVKGCGVSQGYVGIETDNMYRDYLGNMCYKTGDRGVITENGFLKIIGREDRIVKCRGFKVDFSDIEEYCKTYEGIIEAVCLQGKDELIDGYAIMYVSQESINGNDLFNYLKSKYPIYVLPQYLLKVDELPHTISGKVQYANLEELFMKYNKTYIVEEEMSDIESVLKNIFCDLLQVDNLSKFDNFFMIGGHSLLAIELVMRIEEKFNVELMIADIYSGNSSIVELAETITELLDERI